MDAPVSVRLAASSPALAPPPTPAPEVPRNPHPMKRTFALVALLAALGALCKLAFRGDAGAPGAPADPPAASRIDADAALLARYPAQRALVERTLANFHHNALAIEATDGLRGLTLLDKLGFEAIYLYDKDPNDFRQLRDALSDAAAAELLLHWREYFSLKRADDTDRRVLIGEIARLAPAQRRAAARYPNALPLILAEPLGVAELIERWGSSEPDELRDALVALDFISLEKGSADLRAALRILDDHGPTALEAFRLHGPEGFALVGMYGPVLSALGDAMPMSQALIFLRVNTDFVDELLRTGGPEAVASALKRVKSVGLAEAVGGSENGLRLAVEYGEAGERALRAVGGDAADVVYGDYADAALRRPAVEAIAAHGPMALAMLAKYAAEPDFREILRAYGPAVIPPIARADSGPASLAALRAKRGKSWTETLAQGVLAVSGDSGQATIKTIRRDGLSRVQSLESSELTFSQFLPLYDVVHLAGVVGSGYSPTGGELTWAFVDACFATLDVLSLAAVQPEGVAVAEAARAEVKASAREAARGVGREAVEGATRGLAREGAEVVTRRAARWWAVRSAGGTYQVMSKFPEALPRLEVRELAELARPLCARAGLSMSGWRPFQLLKNGVLTPFQIPPRKGVEFLGKQMVVAQVGVVAFAKMEEHLASRRPAEAEPRP